MITYLVGRCSGSAEQSVIHAYQSSVTEDSPQVLQIAFFGAAMVLEAGVEHRPSYNNIVIEGAKRLQQHTLKRHDTY